MLSGERPHGKARGKWHRAPWQQRAPDMKQLKKELEDVEGVWECAADPSQCVSLTQVGRKLHVQNLL